MLCAFVLVNHVSNKSSQKQIQAETPQSETPAKLELFLDDSMGEPSLQKDRLSCSFSEDVKSDLRFTDTLLLIEENNRHIETENNDSSVNIKKVLDQIEERLADTILDGKGTCILLLCLIIQTL